VDSFLFFSYYLFLNLYECECFSRNIYASFIQSFVITITCYQQGIQVIQIILTHLWLSRSALLNIAARAELAQYLVDVFIKVQSQKYLARISSDGNNLLLMDAFSLSKSLHLVNSSYFCFSCCLISLLN
jgi:hypothetical protein